MIKIGLFIVALAVFAAVLGPSLTPYDPAAQTLDLPAHLGQTLLDRQDLLDPLRALEEA